VLSMGNVIPMANALFQLQWSIFKGIARFADLQMTDPRLTICKGTSGLPTREHNVRLYRLLKHSTRFTSILVNCTRRPSHLFVMCGSTRSVCRQSADWRYSIPSQPGVPDKVSWQSLFPQHTRNVCSHWSRPRRFQPPFFQNDPCTADDVPGFTGRCASSPSDPNFARGPLSSDDNVSGCTAVLKSPLLLVVIFRKNFVAFSSIVRFHQIRLVSVVGSLGPERAGTPATQPHARMRRVAPSLQTQAKTLVLIFRGAA
jgi:hypothetical protein